MYLSICPNSGFWLGLQRTLRLKLQIFKILKRVEIVGQNFDEWEDDNHNDTRSTKF